MKFGLLHDTATTNRLRQLLRAAGLLMVLAVNALVLLSDSHLTGIGPFREITVFMEHANEHHQVNNAPFSFSLHFSPAADFVMGMLPVIPLAQNQPAYALLCQCIAGLFSIGMCFYLFRGEENKNSQFIPGVIIQPPRLPCYQ